MNWRRIGEAQNNRSNRARRLKSPLLVALLGLAAAWPATVAAREKVAARALVPGGVNDGAQIVEVRKLLNTKTGELGFACEAAAIQSMDDVDAIVAERVRKDREKFGALSPRLRDTLKQMGPTERIRVRMILKARRMHSPNPADKSDDELRSLSAALAVREPVVSAGAIVARYRLENAEFRPGRVRIHCNVTPRQL